MPFLEVYLYYDYMSVRVYFLFRSDNFSPKSSYLEVSGLQDLMLFVVSWKTS